MRSVPLTPFGSSDHWSWWTDAYPPMWFCIRALLYDGLRIGPFDQHPAGDGRLQALGLDADIWLEWVFNVLRQKQIMAEFALDRQPGALPSEAERQRVLAAGSRERFGCCLCLIRACRSLARPSTTSTMS